MQKLFRLTAELAGSTATNFPSTKRTTTETRCAVRHSTDAQEIILAVRPGIEIPVTSHRVGDAKGEHIVRAASDHDTLELRHDAHSRRGFALGAVRGAEWLAGKSGAWDFREIFDQL